MRVYAVSNQKGGVAKTTTAISLAAALAGFGRRVLAVDLDPQANLTLGVGVRLEDGRPTTLEVLTGGATVADAAVPTEVPGLECLPADVGLTAAERRLYGEPAFDEILGRCLAPVASRYDYAVVDCPPSLGPLTMNALAAGASVLVPVQCEYFSAKGLDQLLDVIALVRERRAADLALRVLPTLYDRRNRVAREVLAELKRAFPEELVPVVIDVDTRLREAAAHGRPIGVHAPTARAAVQYRTLALEIVRIEEGEQAARDAVAERVARPTRTRRTAGGAAAAAAAGSAAAAAARRARPPARPPPSLRIAANCDWAEG